MDRGIETSKLASRVCADSTVRLLNSRRRGGFFVLQCQVADVAGTVDGEPAGEAPDLPPVDEEMERELMGREEVPPPVAIEVPAPCEPTRRAETSWTHDHKSSQAHPSSNATVAP